MNEQLHTLEHAQQTAIDLAIQSGLQLLVHDARQLGAA
jgi:hypothetical protein